VREQRDSLYVRAGGVACALASDTETSRRGFRQARRDGDGDGCFVRFIRSQVKVTITIHSPGPELARATVRWWRLLLLLAITTRYKPEC